MLRKTLSNYERKIFIKRKGKMKINKKKRAEKRSKNTPCCEKFGMKNTF